MSAPIRKATPVSSPTDAVRASVLVRLPPSAAFRLFTTRIDAWWRRGPRFRRTGSTSGLIHLEPGIGGRLFESWGGDDGAEPFVAEVGRVLHWDAPRAIAFSWRGGNFEPQQTTLVEVSFEPAGEAGEGTLVTVRHSGWDGLPEQAPVRHGQRSGEFLQGMGLWWGALLSALRGLAAAEPPAAGGTAVLREAMRADVPGIQYVRHAVQENRLSSRCIDDAEVIEYLERHGRGWVVEQGGEVIAFAVGDARDGNIWALFVDPAHEGRGHGRRLHDTMVGWLFAQGLTRLWLSTGEDTRARGFYAWCGWHETGPAPGGEVRMELEGRASGGGATLPSGGRSA